MIESNIELNLIKFCKKNINEQKMNVEEWVKAIKEDLEREDLPESYKKVLKVVLNLIESGDLDTAKEIAVNLPPILE